MKLIPTNTVVHTPTEEDVKELFTILHKSGYKWKTGMSLASHTNWEAYQSNTYYFIYPTEMVVAFGDDRSVLRSGQHVITLAEFKELYCEVTEQLTEQIDKSSVIQEKPQPKFNRGDKVRVQDNATLVSNIGKIATIVKEGQCCKGYGWVLDISKSVFLESELVPYTESETKPTEDMEATELNLCELLKGHEGEKFYSLSLGEVTLKKIENDCVLCFINEEADEPMYVNSDGTSRYGIGGVCLIYPSRVLYEQCPLDPLKAWSVWQKEQKKWKLRIGYSREDSIPVGDIVDLFFRTSIDREQAIEEIQAIIEKYSK